MLTFNSIDANWLLPLDLAITFADASKRKTKRLKVNSRYGLGGKRPNAKMALNKCQLIIKAKQGRPRGNAAFKRRFSSNKKVARTTLGLFKGRQAAIKSYPSLLAASSSLVR